MGPISIPSDISANLRLSIHDNVRSDTTTPELSDTASDAASELEPSDPPTPTETSNSDIGSAASLSQGLTDAAGYTDTQAGESLPSLPRQPVDRDELFLGEFAVSSSCGDQGDTAPYKNDKIKVSIRSPIRSDIPRSLVPTGGDDSVYIRLSREELARYDRGRQAQWDDYRNMMSKSGLSSSSSASSSVAFNPRPRERYDRQGSMASAGASSVQSASSGPSRMSGRGLVRLASGSSSPRSQSSQSTTSYKPRKPRYYASQRSSSDTTDEVRSTQSSAASGPPPPPSIRSARSGSCVGVFAPIQEVDEPSDGPAHSRSANPITSSTQLDNDTSSFRSTTASAPAGVQLPRPISPAPDGFSPPPTARSSSVVSSVSSFQTDRSTTGRLADSLRHSRWDRQISPITHSETDTLASDYNAVNNGDRGTGLSRLRNYFRKDKSSPTTAGEKSSFLGGWKSRLNLHKQSEEHTRDATYNQSTASHSGFLSAIKSRLTHNRSQDPEGDGTSIRSGASLFRLQSKFNLGGRRNRIARPDVDNDQPSTFTQPSQVGSGKKSGLSSVMSRGKRFFAKSKKGPSELSSPPAPSLKDHPVRVSSFFDGIPEHLISPDK
ncbi:hypothetical protein IAU59_005232 [Kwoniella sp. CBS 9459]